MINSCRITSVVSALDILESPWYCEGEVEDLSFDITLDMLTNPVNSWAVGDLEYDETKDYVLWLLPGFESAEKKRKTGERGRKGDVDTCSKEAKEFCLLLGDISAFCCGKDLPFTALLKHLQSLEI